jgi:hypothetical protein
MLETSGHGHHVEQVEVVFSPGLMPVRVIAAWAETVANTEALRLQFLMDDRGWHAVPFAEVIRDLNTEATLPDFWEAWLAADRARPLLTPESMPWRAVYWPAASRFIWTFHHALLDGRSITRILKSFFERIGGRNPGMLEIARWQPASPETSIHVRKLSSHEFAGHAHELSPDQESPESAVRHLGEPFLRNLEFLAKSMVVTVPTLLTWSWGQALAREWEMPWIVVEQLRAGPPQPGTAGFTMNILPVQIVKACRGDAFKKLQAFRKQLLELRRIENISLDAVYNGNPPDNSVIMIEHRTMAHELAGPLMKSLKLHEAKGKALGATAHILPDLRLEVEGPKRHRLLKAWVQVLEDQMAGV